MIQSLEAMQDTVTPRTVIEQNLSAASKQRTYAAKAIVRFYQNDSLGNADSVKYYLKNLSTFNSYCQLAEVYFQEGNTTQSTAYYDSLETQFELTPTQQNEVTQFKALNTLRMGLLGENRGIDSLTTGEVNQLQTIADTSYLMAGAMARAMLRHYQDPYLPEVTLPNPNFTKRVPIAIGIKVPWPVEENQKEVYEKLQPEMEVFPNPSNEGFTVKLTAINPNSKLIITDLHGKVVYSKNLNEQESTQTIATLGWAKGVYQASIEVDGLPIIKEKLILQ